MGASVVFVRSTKEALEFLRIDSYYLIISDIHREENGGNNLEAGYELLDVITARNLGVPFIIYTGRVTKFDTTRSTQAYGITDNQRVFLSMVLDALNVHPDKG